MDQVNSRHDVGATSSGFGQTGQVYFYGKRVAAQTTSSAVNADIAIDTVVVDTDNFFDSGSPTHITIPSDGQYRVIVNVRWAGSADTVLRAAEANSSASSRIVRRSQTNIDNASYQTLITLLGSDSFVAGDFIKVIVRQLTGADQDVTFMRILVFKILP